MISPSTAPPQLHNVVGCWGNEEDECTLAQNAVFFPYTPYYIYISYDGNGPFSVEWYHNYTYFTCSTFKLCQEIEYGSTYQVRKHIVVKSVYIDILLVWQASPPPPPQLSLSLSLSPSPHTSSEAQAGSPD